MKIRITGNADGTWKVEGSKRSGNRVQVTQLKGLKKPQDLRQATSAVEEALQQAARTNAQGYVQLQIATIEEAHNGS